MEGDTTPKSVIAYNNLYSREMVASITPKLNTEGSAVLHYTTLNVDALQCLMFISRHDNVRPRLQASCL